MKKKIIITFILMVAVLFALPFIFVKVAEPHELMGTMILLFFVLNPLTAAVIHSMIGTDIRNLWWILRKKLRERIKLSMIYCR